MWRSFHRHGSPVRIATCVGLAMSSRVRIDSMIGGSRSASVPQAASRRSECTSPSSSSPIQARAKPASCTRAVVTARAIEARSWCCEIATMPLTTAVRMRFLRASAASAADLLGDLPGDAEDVALPGRGVDQEAVGVVEDELGGAAAKPDAPGDRLACRRHPGHVRPQQRTAFLRPASFLEIGLVVGRGRAAEHLPAGRIGAANAAVGGEHPDAVLDGVEHGLGEGATLLRLHPRRLGGGCLGEDPVGEAALTAERDPHGRRTGRLRSARRKQGPSKSRRRCARGHPRR